MMPRRRITSAGRGFRDIGCVVCSSAFDGVVVVGEGGSSAVWWWLGGRED